MLAANHPDYAVRPLYRIGIPDGPPMTSGAAFGNMAATSSILPNMWSVLAKPTPIFRLLAAKEKHCVENLNYIP